MLAALLLTGSLLLGAPEAVRVDGPRPIVRLVIDELRLRLPELIVDSRSDANDGKTYRVEIELPDEERHTIRLIVTGPDGIIYLSGDVDRGDSRRASARAVAVLVEGVVRIDFERLEAMLPSIAVKRVPAPAPPIPESFSVEARLGGGILPRGSRPVAEAGLAVELHVWRWLWPRLDVSAAWPQRATGNDVRLTVWEGSTALLLQAAVDAGEGRLLLAAGPTVHLIHAEARPTGERPESRSTIHAGVRIGATGVLLPATDWHPSVALWATYLPEPPEHLWRGESVFGRETWQVTASVGLRYGS